MTKPNKEPQESLFHSSFTIKAKICCSILILTESLRNIPCLEKKPKESAVYIIKEGLNDSVSEIEFDKSIITLRYSFLRPSLIVYTRNLLRLLSIIAYLDGLYSIEIESLYKYVIEALRKHMEETLKDNCIKNGELLLKRIKSLAEMNAELSLGLIESRRVALVSNNEAAILRHFCKEIISSTKEKVKHVGEDDSYVARSLGIKREILDQISSIMANNGDKNAK